MHKVRTMLVSVAAAGMAFAPVASAAGTRAASSPVTVDARGSAPVAGESEASGKSLVWLLLLLAVLAGILAAGGGGGGDGGRSRG
jgi:hypothetical protein